MSRLIIAAIAATLALAPAVLAAADETKPLGAVAGKASMDNSFTVTLSEGQTVKVRDIVRLHRGTSDLGEAMVIQVNGNQATIVPMASCKSKLQKGDQLEFARQAGPIPTTVPQPVAQPQPQPQPPQRQVSGRRGVPARTTSRTRTASAPAAGQAAQPQGRYKLTIQSVRFQAEETGYLRAYYRVTNVGDGTYPGGTVIVRFTDFFEKTLSSDSAPIPPLPPGGFSEGTMLSMIPGVKMVNALGDRVTGVVREMGGERHVDLNVKWSTNP